jgi:hypothetical protein
MTKDTLSTEYDNVMVVSGSQVDILKKLHMNGFKIENVGTPTADNDAVNKKYVDDNVAVNGKQAFNLTGSSSNKNIGTHSFTIPTISTNTNYLITSSFNMNFSGTYSNTNEITAIFICKTSTGAPLLTQFKTFHPFVKDIGASSNFVSNMYKYIIVAPSTTAAISITFEDFETTTSRTYNHVLEIERL